MGILVKRKAVESEIKEIPKPLPVPVRREKVNWDPYYIKCKNHSKRKEENVKVKAKVGAIVADKKEAKEVVKKANGPTIDDTWIRILSAAVGKRLTDKAIAINMMAACPGHKYTEAAVAGHRSGYNCGRFPCQKGIKPEVRLEKFEAPVVKK